MVKEQFGAVWNQICAMCARLSRDPASITLVGVTKYADVSAVNEAILAGLTHVGENKVQEAEEKFAGLVPSGQVIIKHMIGHLQTNKVKEAVRIFDMIQSVDSLKLIDEIEKRASQIDKVQDVLIQLDISKEEQKFGLPENELDALLVHALGLPHVRIQGLMTLAPLTDDRERIHLIFRRCWEIYKSVSQRKLNPDRIQMKYLSMGMTNDYEIALEEGANMLRIGSAIFK